MTTHKVRSYEMRANKRASAYFGKYYNVDWKKDYELEWPTYNPFDEQLKKKNY